MYEAHYGFTEKPFNLTPDPRFLYLSARHTEAFAHLEFGRRERGGFIVITGDVGTGKTTLARCFLSRLDARTSTAFVLYPALSAVELLQTVLEELHVPVRGTSLKAHVDALHAFLLVADRQGRQVVLLIDEAQDLSPDVLEQVRLISNLETDTRKLIQIVLMGQSELADILARHDLRQIAQRVTARYHLGALDREETREYIHHRITVAGGAGKVAFTARALAAVHRASGGVPRVINLLCDRALLAGYVAGTRTIDEAMVDRAAAEVLVGRRRSTAWPRSAGTYAVGTAALALAGVAFVRTGRAPAAPPATAVAAPTAPPSAVPVPGYALDEALVGLAGAASFTEAVRALQERWGTPTLQRTSLRADLVLLRRLDFPAVLEMEHPVRGEPCYVALLGLGAAEARVAAGGVVRAVPVADLERRWTRQAVVLWRDFDGVAEASPERAAEWTRATLRRLGYVGPTAEVDVAAALGRFQRDAGLAPDGVLGARTLMMLYGLGRHERPRLAPVEVRR